MQWIEPSQTLTEQTIRNMMDMLYKQKIVDTQHIVMHPKDFKLMEDVMRTRAKKGT